MQEHLQETKKNLIAPSATRWLAYEQSIQRILELFVKLVKLPEWMIVRPT